MEVLDDLPDLTELIVFTGLGMLEGKASPSAVMKRAQPDAIPAPLTPPTTNSVAPQDVQVGAARAGAGPETNFATLQQSFMGKPSTSEDGAGIRQPISIRPPTSDDLLRASRSHHSRSVVSCNVAENAQILLQETQESAFAEPPTWAAR